MQCDVFSENLLRMSLNRYEQTLFDYLGREPDERRHWQGKITEMTRSPGDPTMRSRSLERELWDYLTERSQQVPVLRDLHAGAVRRISLLNLAEHLLRIWGPPLRQKSGNKLQSNDI